jgi:hypothetical protein
MRVGNGRDENVSYFMNINLSYFQKNLLHIVIVALAIASMFLFPAISQDSAYHQFADQRQMLEIPHFINVLSNALFLIVGFMGVKLLLGTENLNIIPEIYWVYLIFFCGVFFVGIGSGYYHLFPSNKTLVWDRLPMTIAFMTLFTIILSEFISIKFGKWVFIPLLILGIFSVWYWHYTEQQNEGDLRLYGLVQFIPILLIPLILIMYPSRFPDTRYYWWLFGLYVLAKVFEATDEYIYSFLSIISGHSIKHLCGGVACYCFYAQLKNRTLLDS